MSEDFFNTKFPVAIRKCDNYDLDNLIEEVEFLFKGMGGISKLLKATDRVLLKPNMILGKKPDEHATTYPNFIEAVVIVLRKHGIRNLSLGDSPGSGQVTSDIVNICGFKDICKKYSVSIVDLKTEKDWFNKDAKLIKKFILAKELDKFDKIVNLPKLKTHVLAQMTCAVKNYYGLIPGHNKAKFHLKMQDHLDFSQLMLDLYHTIDERIPTINLMDGIWGMEGNGPTAGTPKHFGVIMASTSAIALDTVAEKVSAIKDVTTNIVARRNKLPEAFFENIKIVGDSIESVRTKKTKKPVSVTKYIPKFLYGFLKNQLLQYPVVNKAMCISCSKCKEVCPVSAITMEAIKFKGKDKKIPVFDYKKCIRCYCCQEMCPAKAITVKKPFLLNLFTGFKR